MKITKLLERAGDRLKTQRLDTSFVAMKQKKQHAEITFCTDKGMADQITKSIMTGTKADYVGVVVWIPVDAWENTNNRKDTK